MNRARAGDPGKDRPTPDISVHLEDMYRLLVESVQDYAIFAMDPKGHILSWNAGAERFKGWTADEIIGQHFSTFYPQEAKDRKHPEYELEVAAREGRYEEEGWRVRKDGTQFWANVVITTIYDSAKNVLGYAKVTRDLTERREAQMRAIADARRVAEAEAANRAKAEFLTSLSHELRTPLNAIGGYVDLMLMGLRGDITPQMHADLERVKNSQQHLLALINDLLNFSRIEAGRLSYDIEPFPVAPMLERVVGMLEPQALLKGIQLSNAGCDSSAVMVADAPKVEQILINLLTNAVKFTGSGGTIVMDCHIEERAVDITVTDSGVGIPPEMQEAIFEPFVQLGRSLTSAHEGAGLGLSISRELARFMKGDLKVTSTPGQGSRFTLTLPNQADPKQSRESVRR